MGCDDGWKYIDISEGNPRTILSWYQTEVFKLALDEHDDPGALVSHVGPMGP
jgi:hypothetical protein